MLRHARNLFTHLLLVVGHATASSPSSFAEPVVRNSVTQIIRLVGAHAHGAPVDEDALLPPITVLRKLLSRVDPPIDEVIGSGVVPSLITMLEPAFGYTLRTEAAWTITNIASGTAEHTSLLLRLEAAKPLIAALSEGLDISSETAARAPRAGRDLTEADRLTMAALAEADEQADGLAAARLGQPQGMPPPAEVVLDAGHEETPLEQMRAQAAWAIANLVADSSANREQVAAHGGLDAMLRHVRSVRAPTAAQTATWALANFYRFGASAADVRRGLPVFARLLFSSDAAVVSDAAWALTYISKDDAHAPLLLQTLPDRSLAYLLPSAPGAAVASSFESSAMPPAAASSSSSSSASGGGATEEGGGVGPHAATPRQVAAALMAIARELNLVPVGGDDGSGGGAYGGGGSGSGGSGGSADVGLMEEWQLPSGYDHRGVTSATGSGDVWLEDEEDIERAGAAGESLVEEEEGDEGLRERGRHVVCGSRMASWLVQLLGHESARVPALKTIGNLAAGADAHAQAVVDCGLVPRLRRMLDGSGGRRGREGTATPDELAREVAFTLSNLAAGTAQQLRATLRAGVLPGLFHLMEPFVEEASERNARNFREEPPPPPFWPKTNWAAVALVNVLARGTPQQVQRVVRAGCDVLCA